MEKLGRTTLAILISLMGFCCAVILKSGNSQAHVFEECCPPPVDQATARFPQNAQVTVYLNTTGLSDTEIQAITVGLQDWSDENNNSGVKYNVVLTTNPPAVGGSNTIVAYFINESVTWNGGSALNMHSASNSQGTSVYGELRFWNNIRSGTPSLLAGFLRATSRHEGGHGLGLGNADDCPQGSTIMNPSLNQETFITTCDNDKIKTESAYPSPTPATTPTPEPAACPGVECNEGSGFPVDNCSYAGGCPSGWFSTGQCCQPFTPSPIVIDVDGSGLHLTDATTGVLFDFFSLGRLQLSWTASGSTNAFLVLDRNSNGIIDNGAELFGNLTLQPKSPDANGFLALAQYDLASNGGNGDYQISKRDAIFSQLRLWRDLNHNGVSEASELSLLQASDIESIDLNYRLSARTDHFKNRFRYRAKVNGSGDARIGRWAYDVIFVMAN